MDAFKTSSRDRLLEFLEGLLRTPEGDLKTALVYISDLVAAATGADKIDAFFYDAARDSLVAVGTSNQPLSMLQRKLGLDVLPVSNGGRVVHVYKTGETFVTGHLEDDPEELRGVKEALKIRSKLGVPLVMRGERRGMMMIASLQPEYFTAEDARMAETIGRWVGIVAQRAELAEAVRASAAEQGRRAGAEELVTVLAHDLRNYIAPMRIRLEAVQFRARHGQVDALAEDVGALFKSVDRLEHVVADILDVARIDQGLFQVTPGEVDLGALALSVAEVLGTPLQPVHVNLEKGVAVTVPGDAARLRQCLENLVANAVQKSPEHAPVILIVQRQVQLDGAAWARVEVVDQGPGIAQDMLPHLFERFYSGRRPEGGLGLGLYLAKRIAALHGGELTVESEPGSGTRFILELPASPAPSAAG